jgi:hypothetical protein
MESFVPTHPGNKSHVQVGYVAPSCSGADITPPSKATATASWNVGEEQREMVWQIKNYTLPQVRTTYIDFVFNFDDDEHDIYHIVWGDAIVDLPNHLHHFVVTGCSEKFPEDEVGKPLTYTPSVCDKSVGGFAGWAPGNTLWDSPVTAGTPIGRGVGVVAVSVNVHYTDAHLVAEKLVSQDGIRLFYTPDLRSQTTIGVNVINIGNANVAVPTQKSRHFMTRKCVVNDGCADNEALAKESFGGATCAEGFAFDANFCTYPNVADFVCPKTCNKCESVMPVSPVAVNYHAHLLGREMYFTLTKAKTGEIIDLNSAPVWYYDDQAVFSLKARNLTVEVGDTLQTTCVFNSMERTEDTYFGRETIDEMCINTVLFELKTDSKITEFGPIRCEGNIWTGDFLEGEDPRNIHELHPESLAANVYDVSDYGTIMEDSSGTSFTGANCPEWQTWTALCSRDANIDCENVPPNTLEKICDEYVNVAKCEESVFLNVGAKIGYREVCKSSISICGPNAKLTPTRTYLDPLSQQTTKCQDADNYCAVSDCGRLADLRDFFKDTCCTPKEETPTPNPTPNPTPIPTEAEKEKEEDGDSLNSAYYIQPEWQRVLSCFVAFFMAV